MEPQNTTNIPSLSPGPAQTPTAAITKGDGDITIDLTGAIELSDSQDSVYHYFVASPMYAGFGDLASPERVYFLQDFSKMSPNLKNYLTSADTVELIFSIGKDSNLDDGQISELGVLIRELLTGKTFIRDFSITVSSKLGIDDVKAQKITNDLASKSFRPIIEDIKRIQRSKFPDKISQLQKESQPQGLGPVRPALPREEELRKAPLTQPTARQDSPQTVRREPVERAPLPTLPQPPPDIRTPQIPQFKIPAPLGARLAPEGRPDLGVTLPPRAPLAGPSSQEKAKQSFEEELEKVAGVIDLRARPKE